MAAQITLLRHGQSEGNVARGRARRDAALRDCGLTRRGVEEARQVGRAQDCEPELIVVSPLRRALLTALHLNFRQCKIIVHPGLREMGDPLPENQPLPLHKLLQSPDLSRMPRLDDVDFSLLPANWGSAGAGSRDDIQDALRWLKSRTERNIWVVCHFNVIHEMVATRRIVRNCVPIVCRITSSSSTDDRYPLTEIDDSSRDDHDSSEDCGGIQKTNHIIKKDSHSVHPSSKTSSSGCVSLVLEAKAGKGALLVGNADFAADEKALETAGVNAVLTVGGAARAKEKADRVIFRIAVSDRQDVPLLPDFLDKTTAWIHEQRVKYNRTTLVHCRAGQHRSPMVAAAYLLKFCDLSSVDAAMATLLNLRPAATFRPHVQIYLREWWSSQQRGDKTKEANKIDDLSETITSGADHTPAAATTAMMRK